MLYNFKEIENKWQKFWAENNTFKAQNNSKLPKFYVLDMFPYPSGAGLHVGHPLGYIASDIYSRYKRLKGFIWRESEQPKTKEDIFKKKITANKNAKEKILFGAKENTSGKKEIKLNP